MEGMSNSKCSFITTSISYSNIGFKGPLSSSFLVDASLQFTNTMPSLIVIFGIVVATRLKERRKRRSEGFHVLFNFPLSYYSGKMQLDCVYRLHFAKHNDEEIEQRKSSANFLVELCDTISYILNL
uniref:Uncharacterized protein n=1 Tax=Lactuca sativa TaxID=4236 RepID=A0A9R1XTF1_LACSA|nr:hypothetical protein LSAT_V11C100039800 [Lactuca sativa]